MTNTRTLKPVDRFDLGHSFYGYAEMQTSETGDYVEFLAYEALQKENERLDFKFKHYWARIRKVLQKHRERDAAQAKRISDLKSSLQECMDEAAEWLNECRGIEPEQLTNHAWYSRAKALLEPTKDE